MFYLALFLFSAILFFVLVPGVIVSLPHKSNKYIVAAVHALIYAIILTLIWYFSYNAIWNLTEGFETKQTMGNPSMGMQQNMSMEPSMGMPTMGMQPSMGMQQNMSMEPSMGMPTMGMSNMPMPTMGMSNMAMPTMDMANMGMQSNIPMPNMSMPTMNNQSYE